MSAQPPFILGGMTLLLTAVTPEGTVLGTDSALTQKGLDFTLALSGFQKIVPVRAINSAISFAGDARIGGTNGTWLPQWLWKYVNEVAADEPFTPFVNHLAETMTESATPDETHYLHVAGWVMIDDGAGQRVLAPRAVIIARDDTETYRATAQVTDEQIREIVEWRRTTPRPNSYPVHMFEAGVARGYAQWGLGEGVTTYGRLIGGDLLRADVTCVAEYVRFLITTYGELLRISRRPTVVYSPVEIMLIHPTGVTMISTRY